MNNNSLATLIHYFISIHLVLLNIMKRITNLHKNAETLWSCSCPFPVITQSKRFINSSTRGISEHVICVQHHYISVQNPNRSWKTTHQLKISLPLWTCVYISELTGDQQPHSCTDPRDQTQRGSKHTSAGPRFTASKLGYQETSSTFLSVKHANTHKNTCISPSRLAGGRYGNDGRKTRVGLWVQNWEIFWVWSMNAVFIWCTSMHNERLGPRKIKQSWYKWFKSSPQTSFVSCC